MRARLALIASSVVLASCGGGGSSNSPTSNAATPVAASQTPAGLYSSEDGSGNVLTNVVLTDNSLYSLLQSNKSLSSVVVTTGSTSDSTYTSSSSVEFDIGGGATNLSISAKFVPKQSFNGNVTVNNTTNSFNSSYNQAYDNQITATQIAGSYTGAVATLSGSNPDNLTVNSDLTFTGSADTCTFSGLLRQDHGPVFSATVTFPAGCPFANQTLNGLGLFDVSNGQLVLAVVPQNRSNIFVLLDQKSNVTPTNSCPIFNPNSACVVGGITTPATPPTPASGPTSTGGGTNSGSGSESCTNPTTCSSSGSTSTGSSVGTVPVIKKM